MAILSPVTTQLQFFDANNAPLLSGTDADMLTWTTTFTVKFRVDFTITASPVAYVVNNVIGATPVCLYVYNPNLTDITMASTGITTLTIPAGKGILLPSFTTTANLTLSTVGGGIAKVLVLD